MSAVVIAGDTSGTITLNAPAVAGTTTLTLPATTGTVLTSVSPASDLPSSIKGPAFSAYKSTSQSISSLTNTKIQLNAENFDTNSNYDNSTNYRFTPTVAGYYQFSFGLIVETTTTSNWVYTELNKNGSPYSRGASVFAASVNYPSSTGSCLVYLNGSTDYVELYATTSATLNVYAENRGSFMTGTFVRSA
jgi:hypothetical protein